MNDSRRPTGAVGTIPDPAEVELRELLEQAGPRPEVPAQALERIRAATRAEWERLPKPSAAPARRLRLGLALAASLLVAVAIGWLALRERALPAPPVFATVELVRGAARFDSGGLPTPEEDRTLQAGGSLPAGATLATGPDGLVSLRLTGGGSLRLDAATRLRLVSPTEVALETGAVYIDSDSVRAGAEPIAIDTALGRVREIGTRFEVRIDGGGRNDELMVRVRDGRVALERGAREHSVGAGEGLWLHRDGSIETRTVATHGSEWDWVLAAAPAPDVEGRPLASFLDWVAREAGWSVAFEDAELAEEAATIELHGTISDLRPEEALEVVIPGAGLAYRIQEDVLYVSRR